MPNRLKRVDEVTFDSPDFREVLWRSLGYPIRPDETIICQLMAWIDTSAPTLILGATPEFIAALVTKGCTQITVVDHSAVALEVMQSILEANPASLEVVCDDWISFLGTTRTKWNSVLMDCGLLFLDGAERPNLFRAIATMLYEKNGSFVSRQLVKGSPLECRTVWWDALASRPTRESISCLYIANAIMAANFGRKNVSYPALQEFARKTLDILRQRYGDILDPTYSACLEAFLRVDTRSSDFVRQMKSIPSPAELELLATACFKNVSTIYCTGKLSSYYRLVYAGGPLK